MESLVHRNIEIEEKCVSGLDIGRARNKLRTVNWGTHLGGFSA